MKAGVAFLDGGKVLELRPAARAQQASEPEPRHAPSDEAMVAACALGDRAALGVLFDRHHDALQAFLERLARAHPSEIDDLVQATFLEVWTAARRFQGTAAVRTWIFGIASNLVRRRIRTAGRQRAALAVLTSAWPQRADGHRPDDAVAHAQLVARLGDAIAALSHDLREVFLLCEVEGVPGVEVARVLGLREGTVWRRLHTARRRLRAALEGGVP